MAILEVERSTLQRCTLFDLEKANDKTASLKASSGLKIIYCNFKTMQKAINKCKELSQKYYQVSSDAEEVSLGIDLANPPPLFSFWRGLVPGTKVITTNR